MYGLYSGSQRRRQMISVRSRDLYCFGTLKWRIARRFYFTFFTIVILLFRRRWIHKSSHAEQDMGGFARERRRRTSCDRKRSGRYPWAPGHSWETRCWRSGRRGVWAALLQRWSLVRPPLAMRGTIRAAGTKRY